MYIVYINIDLCSTIHTICTISSRYTIETDKRGWIFLTIDHYDVYISTDLEWWQKKNV